MSDCIFCQIVAGTIPSTNLYQDDRVLVIKDINPQAPVHLLVLPRKHVADVLVADDELLAHMLKTVKKIIAQESIVNYRVVSNGKGAALIDHLHIHILGSIDKFRKL